MFIMLGKKNYLTGGYIVNFRFLEALKNKGVDVYNIHYTTVPSGLPTTPIKASFYILKKIIKYKPDLIIISKSYPYVFFLRIINIFLNIPVLYMMHLIDMHEDKSSYIIKMIKWLYIKWILNMAKSIWVNSNFIKKELQHYGFKKQIIQIIPPGIEKIDFVPTKKYSNKLPLKILSIGNVIPRKNQFLLVKACSLLLKETFMLTIIGSLDDDPEYVKCIIELIKSNGLGSNIKLTGKINQMDSIKNNYITSDLFIHTAFSEGYGMVISEAMWYGLPIIALNNTAIPELIIHNDNGFLLNDNNPENLAILIENFIKNKDLRITMGKRSHEIADKFNSWKDSCEAFYSLSAKTAGW